LVLKTSHYGWCGISPCEILQNVGEISYFFEISLYRNSFQLLIQYLCYSIEHIKLKLLLFSKLYTHFALRNFVQISQHCAKIMRNFTVYTENFDNFATYGQSKKERNLKKNIKCINCFSFVWLWGSKAAVGTKSIFINARKSGQF
jgi:hypothetical protein